jgi:peptidoglycan/LPS O-acetylase OafA/YrhL
LTIFKDPKSKDIPLEAIRGIAALVVVMNHSLVGFLPQAYGLIPSLERDRMQGSILYIFMNGAGAVSLFFVLSGYVLTRRYCATGDTRILVRGAVKRWPRLMGPVLVTVLISYSLFYFHLYHFAQAGARSGSGWLTEFADGFLRLGLPNATVQSIHLRTALEQGSFLVFFRGDAMFDSSLWTMQPELLGSFIAFGAAPLLLHASKSSRLATLWLIVMLVVSLHFLCPQLVAFPVGVAMAVLLPRGASLQRRYAYPALLAAIYLLGYGGTAIGNYAPFRYLVAEGMPYAYPQVVGAAILISVIETFPPIRQSFSGKFSAFLGDLSFPIYLLHALVICSIGSWVYLRFGAVPAISSVFGFAILASLPLMIFNDWWIARVNSLTELIFRKRVVSPGAGAGPYAVGEVSGTVNPAQSTQS